MSGRWQGTRVAPDADDLLVWTLDESAPPYPNSGTGGTADLSGNGPPTYNQDGVFASSKSVRFPGTNNYRLYSPDNILTTAFPVTLSCWVYPVAYTSYGVFVAKVFSSSSWSAPYATFLLRYTNSNDGSWQTMITVGSNVNVYASPPAGTYGYRLWLYSWHHIGITYDGTYLSTYVNGYRCNRVAETRALTYGSGAWTVGDYLPSGTNPFNGYVDDIRFAQVARDGQWFNDVYTKGWAWPGSELTGIGKTNYYESNIYGRGPSFDGEKYNGVGDDNYYSAGLYGRGPSFDAEAWKLPDISGGGAVVYFEMRAWRISQSKYIYWESEGAPDPTGSKSGVPAIDLQDIVVNKQYYR